MTLYGMPFFLGNSDRAEKITVSVIPLSGARIIFSAKKNKFLSDKNRFAQGRFS